MQEKDLHTVVNAIVYYHCSEKYAPKEAVTRTLHATTSSFSQGGFEPPTPRLVRPSLCPLSYWGITHVKL